MELKKEIESLLFSSGKVMTEKELAELINSSEQEVNEALESLKKEYDERDTSLMLVQSSGGWKLNVREKYMNLVTKIIADTELAFPVLETLAVIAYKAPVLQSEVIKIRGTNAYEQIGVLVTEEFIEKRKEGRSFKLSLTAKFFKYFDVAGDNDIKEALNDVKIPDKVGKLNVVDIPPEELKKEEEKEKKKLGDLEIIDEAEVKPEEKASIENNKPDENFLEDIEKRINDLSKKNDDLDQDELFKRQEEVNKEMEEEKTPEEPVEEKKEGEVTEEAAPAEEEKEESTEKAPAEEEEEEKKEEETPAEEPKAKEAPSKEEEKKEE